MPAFWKPVSVILLGVVLTSGGQILFAKCVKERYGSQARAESNRHWQELCAAFADRRAAVGVLCMLIAFPLGLLALEMADVSVAVPMGAVSYILATLFGKFYLGEQVGPLRWLGTVAIVVGTLLIGVSAWNQGHARTD